MKAAREDNLARLDCLFGGPLDCRFGALDCPPEAPGGQSGRRPDWRQFCVTGFRAPGGQSGRQTGGQTGRQSRPGGPDWRQFCVTGLRGPQKIIWATIGGQTEARRPGLETILRYRISGHRMQGPSLRVRVMLVHTFREPTFEGLRRWPIASWTRQPVLQPTSPWLWLHSWSRGNSGLRKFYDCEMYMYLPQKYSSLRCGILLRGIHMHLFLIPDSISTSCLGPDAFGKGWPAQGL